MLVLFMTSVLVMIPPVIFEVLMVVFAKGASNVPEKLPLLIVMDLALGKLYSTIEGSTSSDFRLWVLKLL